MITIILNSVFLLVLASVLLSKIIVIRGSNGDKMMLVLLIMIMN